MQLSESWLREWANPAVDSATLTHQLSMAGLEVDSLTPAAPAFDKVVIGRVLSLVQHPDADKLRVAQVDVGSEQLQIVCGAKNVAEGMHVPVALVGSRLPGDFAIKRAKLRGVESNGMICSASELGLAETSEGIMPLPADTPIGMNFRDYLQLDDQCIEVDLTPDRADCLSVLGIARDVTAIHNCALVDPIGNQDILPVIDDRFAVEVIAQEACPRYLSRIVRGIDAAAETPLWLRERLRRSGIRSLGPVVDVTNYVLLELGQPMHAFDLQSLSGSLQVRLAQQNESLLLLNDDEVRLRDDTLIIADGNGPIALAGIMGGAHTAVTDETRDIVFEAAFFAPLAMTGRPRAYGLHSDSSHRFERGVDPDLQWRAMQRATALLLAIAGGQPGPVVEHCHPDALPQRALIHLREARISRLLGVSFPKAEVEGILQRLGMQVETVADGWQVLGPSWRFDIHIEADLIEEIARVHGYDNIPSRRGHMSLTLQADQEAGFALDKAKHLLISREYQEVITYSFIDETKARLVQPVGELIRLANPISADMGIMRPSLWAGLLQTAAYNRARQQERLRLFEVGLRFLQEPQGIVQEKCLAGLVHGSLYAEQWGQPKATADFFDVKADLEAVLGLACAPQQLAFVPAEHPILHPGQSARIECDGVTLGWLGQLHPAHEKTFELTGKTWLFELNLERLQNSKALPAFHSLSKFPSIRRDLALVVDQAVSWQSVYDAILQVAPALVKRVELFDLYAGQNIETNRKSLALGLILQDYSKTLTDDDVQETLQVILSALEQNLGAKLRD